MEIVSDTSTAISSCLSSVRIITNLVDEIGEVSDDEEYADDGHEVKL